MLAGMLLLMAAPAMAREPEAREAADVRARAMEELARKNSAGSVAPDFAFSDRDGEERTLHGLPAVPRTLLIFFDPTCDDCAQLLGRLAANERVESMIAKGRLAVVAVYSGSDSPEWRRKSAELPADWSVGLEPDTLESSDLYDFPSMPTLYLLDANKKILIKELSPDRLDEMLTNKEGALKNLDYEE